MAMNETLEVQITVKGIKWDADTKEELIGVPTTIIFSIPQSEYNEYLAFEDEDGFEELISNKISDISGFCHDGWNIYNTTVKKVEVMK